MQINLMISEQRLYFTFWIEDKLIIYSNELLFLNLFIQND